MADEASRENVDAACRRLTSSWVRERAQGGEEEVELCDFYEQYTAAGADAVPPPGVYTLADLRALGRRRRWCPYYLARHTIAAANVVVYNYQYLLDPKVAGMVSRELEKECVVVFDEAHNIDNVCTEALSIELRPPHVEGAARGVRTLQAAVDRSKATDAGRLRAEYERLVSGMVDRGTLAAGGGGGEDFLANPVISEDILAEAVPGNVRRAEHFLALLARLASWLAARLKRPNVEQASPAAFCQALLTETGIDRPSLRACYDRLTSLLKALQVTDMEPYVHVQRLADFATLVGTDKPSYNKGFALIYEPCDERLPAVADPVLQLCCLDASIGMKPVFDRFASVFITSGTLSPLDLYPRLLAFHPVSCASLGMTLTRDCLCPLVVTRDADHATLSSAFDARADPAVVRGYGRMLVDLAAAVPDGLVAFFVSYTYMDALVAAWSDSGLLAELMAHKLVFIETADVAETTVALQNFRRACDVGRGAVLLSVARGKVAEGIDFKNHYGRAVVMIGVPYQYTLARPLRARLDFLREAFQIREQDFLSFDALRQAAQCVGRVIREKSDYGLMVFADRRYNQADKRAKLPKWITAQLKDEHLNLSTDMAVAAARRYMREMGQPYTAEQAGRALLSQSDVDRLAAGWGAALGRGGPSLAELEAMQE